MLGNHYICKSSVSYKYAGAGNPDNHHRIINYQMEGSSGEPGPDTSE